MKYRSLGLFTFLSVLMFNSLLIYADTASTQPIDPVIVRIRDEGLNHSHVADTLDYLCNVIGQRLTGSPSQIKANNWTRDTLQQWGLSDAHLEAWGPFGRGWSLEHFSFEVNSPYTIVLHGYPKAWSPGTDAPMTLDLVYLDARSPADFAKYAGKLKGKAVLYGLIKPVEAHFEAEATRMTDEELTQLAAATAGKSRNELLQNPATRPTSRPVRTAAGSTSRPSVFAQTAAASFASEVFSFAAKEGAAVTIDASTRGDGGTLFVAQALVPGPTSRPSPRRLATSLPTTRPRVWALDAPAIPPQITLADEDFNRLLHMISHGEHLKIALDMRVKFYPPTDVHTFNTVAEIPGSDLKDQVVLVGGHLDSWHSGTGATDNGAGAACAMEAIRIIRALDLHPRRTIRVALWTGEEEGLLGSNAYVKKHYGTFMESSTAASQPATQPYSQVIKQPEYERLSVYFNLDNGTGKIRGLFAQSNPAAVPFFKQWLAPFADLGANTVTLANTGSTDHIPFDHIGLPGFQFIQDPMEYFNRTHHSNADVFERVQIDDVKEASTIMAACLWDAANMDQRFPRKNKP